MLLVSKLKAMAMLETKHQQFATDLKSDAVITYVLFPENWMLDLFVFCTEDLEKQSIL